MTYIRCSMCNKLDFDARFDLHFKNKLCCDYQVIDKTPVLSMQTFLHDVPGFRLESWVWLSD